MRILICPDKFKGSLSSEEAARAIARGVRAVMPDAECVLRPVSDGGEGFCRALSKATGARLYTVLVQDARGRPIRAQYGYLASQKTAFLELPAAAGLAQLPPELRDPKLTSTYGLGLLMQAAISRGAKTVWVGLGGSATNDGGTGMARALGWRFLDRRGAELPLGGAALSRLARIVPPEQPVQGVKIFAACDVTNPLCGPQGCSTIFAPQKGASAADVKLLERGMQRLAELGGQGIAKEAGVGAAGGSAFGLRAFLNSELRSGFEIVAEQTKLEEEVRRADLILTGEGAVDAQSFGGKVVGGLYQLALKHRRPLIVLAGAVLLDEKARLHLPGRKGNGLPTPPCLSIVTGPMTLGAATENAAELLESAAARALRLIESGQRLGSRK